MAGRRKKQNNLTLDEQLEAVEKDIAECQMKVLKEKKKELNSRIEEAQKERLYKAVAESGKSIEEILEMLSKEAAEQKISHYGNRYSLVAFLIDVNMTGLSVVWKTQMRGTC